MLSVEVLAYHFLIRIDTHLGITLNDLQYRLRIDLFHLLTEIGASTVDSVLPSIATAKGCKFQVRCIILSN